MEKSDLKLGAIIYKNNVPYTITAINHEYVILEYNTRIDIDTLLSEYTLEGDYVLTPPKLLYE